MPVSVKRLLPQSGNAIFHKGWPCVWYNSFKQSLKHWKNACQRETPPAAERQRHFSREFLYMV
jgi:hypothetical protein